MTREEVEVLELEIDRLRSELLRANRKIARVRACYAKWNGYDQYVQSVLDEFQDAVDGGTE